MTAEHPSTGSPLRRGRRRVALVFGGTSSEHQVSCLTAAGVVSAMDPDRYEVVGIGITRSGRWVLVDVDAVARLTISDGVLPELSEDAVDALFLRGSDEGERGATELAVRSSSALSQMGPVDLAFSLLHGPFGEDGTIQGFFEMMAVRYVGAGVLASAVGMDKHYMKLVLSAAGLPVGPFVAISPREWRQDRAACLDALGALDLPVYVKPARGGSSLGITKVEDPLELRPAIEHAQQYDPKVLVEAGFVNARELECGVLGRLEDEAPQASALGEIRVHSESGFYDYEAKYLPEEQVHLNVPADVEPDMAQQVQDLAVRTFEAIGCEGLARVDVFLTSDQRVYVNEINTMPGFTEHSMFPRLWEASGVSYSQLVERLVELALQRPLGLR